VEPLTLHGLINGYEDCLQGSSHPDEMRVNKVTEDWMRKRIRDIDPFRYTVPTILKFEGADIIVDDDCKDGEVRYLCADNPRTNRTVFFTLPKAGE